MEVLVVLKNKIMKESSRKHIAELVIIPTTFRLLKKMKNKIIRWKTKLDVVKDANNLYHIRFSNDGSNYFEIDEPYLSIDAVKDRLNEITLIIEENGKFEVKSKTNSR